MLSNANRSGEEARRRLLHDMGVEVWYARSRAEEPTFAKADNAPATEATPATHGAYQSTATTDPEQWKEKPFAVVALGVPGALLLVDASRRKQEAVLARDVLRAARRDWTGSVGQARFEWPQPGVSGAPGPALTAFVEKQAEDVGARLVLATHSAARRLGDCPLDLIPVPDLPSLADPRNKLAFWRRLQQLAS